MRGKCMSSIPSLLVEKMNFVSAMKAVVVAIVGNMSSFSPNFASLHYRNNTITHQVCMMKAL